MRTDSRARFEYQLSAAARHIRFAAHILREAQQQEAADEYSMIEAWLQSEMKASLASRRPARITPPLRGASSSSPLLSRQGTIPGLTP
jgi:hypothetical protein